MNFQTKDFLMRISCIIPKYPKFKSCIELGEKRNKKDDLGKSPRTIHAELSQPERSIKLLRIVKFMVNPEHRDIRMG